MKLKSLKKGLIFATLLLVMCIVGNQSEIKINASASMNEVEPNDTYAASTILPINTTCNGTTEGFYDKDWYKITLSKAGKLDLLMSHAVFTSSQYTGNVFRIDLYVSDGSTSLLTFYSDALEKSTAAPSIGLAAGTYYIRVRSEESPLMAYTINANFTESTAWEKEYNNAETVANTISTNKTYSGTLQNSDKDYYKFKLTKPGTISVILSHKNYMASGKYCTVTIKNSSDTQFAKIDSNGTDKSNKISTLGLPAGTYYAVVEDSYYQKPSEVYKLKIGYKASATCETEYNSSFSTADSLKLGTKYTGAGIALYGDTDYYKFSLSQSGYISLYFNHTSSNTSNIYFDVSLYDVNENKIGYFQSNGSDKAKKIVGLGLPKGKYYAVVHQYSSGKNKAYTVQVNYKKVKNYETEDNDDRASADTIKLGSTYSGRTIDNYTESGYDYDYYKFTLTKKSWMNIAISHKSIGGTSSKWSISLYNADGNYVGYDDNGNNSNVTSKGASTYSESGTFLLNKGTYYLKVSGKVPSVTYSVKVSKVSIKAPTITKAASSGKNKIKLTWSRVAGTDKYYVYSSTSKNGKYKLLRSVSGSSCSLTDSTVKKGKTYYYKIKMVDSRYVKYSKKTLTSKLSAAKKIKAK